MAKCIKICVGILIKDLRTQDIIDHFFKWRPPVNSFVFILIRPTLYWTHFETNILLKCAHYSEARKAY